MISKEQKKKIIFFLVSRLGGMLILLLGHLCSITCIGRHYFLELKKKKVPVLFLLWHGRLMLPTYLHRNEGVVPIISLHADGEMIAQAVKRIGFNPVRGSSTRGGNKAFHEMVDALKNGSDGAIMVDGPKGPRHKFKPGAILIAQRAQACLVPITFACKRKIEFKSWDRFNLITPFSKAVVIYGKPVFVPENLSLEELESLKISIEKDMIAYEKQADEYFKK